MCYGWRQQMDPVFLLLPEGSEPRADPDPHHFEKLDPYPLQSGQMDGIRIPIHIKVKRRIPIRIKVKSRIRIRIEVMRVRNNTADPHHFYLNLFESKKQSISKSAVFHKNLMTCERIYLFF
jgi:hypothetical protein